MKHQSILEKQSGAQIDLNLNRNDLELVQIQERAERRIEVWRKFDKLRQTSIRDRSFVSANLRKNA